MSLALFFAQYVSNASTFIFRGLRLCVWVYCSGPMCVGVTVWFDWGGVVSCLSQHKDTLQARRGPKGSRKLRIPDFVTTAQDGGKVVSLTHRPHLLPGNAPDTHFC